MIDRTQQPPIQTTVKPDLLFPEAFHLDNGLPVHFLNTGTQDVTRVDFIFDAGLWGESKPLQAAFTNAMLQEGSQQYSGPQIAEIFDFRGAYLQFVADQHFAVVSLISLNKHLPHLLPVTEDLVKHSVFPEQEFEILVNRRKQRFLLENEKVKVRCQKKFSEVLFGSEHPYSQNVNILDFDRISRDDLVDFYAGNYHSGNCRILVSGKLESNLQELLNHHFGGPDWKKEKLTEAAFNIQSSPQKAHQVMKKEAIQSAIRIGRLMVKKDHPDYPGLEVLNTVLGGFFSSRLMSNIREKKGYTYGIGSTLMNFREAGYLVIATETDKSYVLDTIREVFHELKRLREELIPEDELKRVRRYLLGEYVRNFDGPFAQAQAFRAVDDFGLDYGFYEKYYSTVNHIDAVQLQKLAQQYFNENDFYTVVAGE